MEKPKLLRKKPLQKSTFVPFENEFEIKKLKMLIVTVKYGSQNAIQNILIKNDVSVSIVTNGYGGYFKEGGLFGIGDHQKSIVMAIVREDQTEQILTDLENRFKISKAAFGAAYTIPLTSVAGVTVYKFLSNTRKATKVKSYGKK